MAGDHPTNRAVKTRPASPRPNDGQTSSGNGNQQAPKQRNPLMGPRPWWISFIVVLVLNFLLVQVFLPEPPNPRMDGPSTFFKQKVTADNVQEVTSQGDMIQGTFKTAVTYPAESQQGQQQQTS